MILLSPTHIYLPGLMYIFGITHSMGYGNNSTYVKIQNVAYTRLIGLLLTLISAHVTTIDALADTLKQYNNSTVSRGWGTVGSARYELADTIPHARA